VLRKIFEPASGEVTWEWRRLHNEELCDLYSPNIMKVIKIGNWMGRDCSTYGGQ
jgi:hypothetical protein